LDGIGNEAQDRSDPEKKGEPAEEIFAELDPFWRLLGWCQGIGAVTLKVLPGLRLRQSLQKPISQIDSTHNNLRFNLGNSFNYILNTTWNFLAQKQNPILRILGMPQIVSAKLGKKS
jgi:hypothetical protein